MVKTRSQTGHEVIKKEEQEDHKPSLLLNGVSNTKSNNQITKRKPLKNKNRRLPDQDVKVEEDTDIKSLLQSGSKSLKAPKRRSVSQEQINQLIDYVANHGMSLKKAASKVKMAAATVAHYYNVYRNDPDKKIPSPRNQLLRPKRCYTQEQIGNLIGYLVDDKITIKEASEKANMSYQSGCYYYSRYLEDPDHKIPIPRVCHYYTPDQKNEFIGYIVNDKMTISGASRKAKISAAVGVRCYHKYFDNQNPDIATPSHINSVMPPTQEQIKEIVSYIVDDKMTVRAASKKANVSRTTAARYYRRYLKDNNMELPASRHITQDKIDQFIGYIFDDKMSIKAASKKASMGPSTGNRYYHRYLKENNICAPSFKYTQDQKNEFIGYMVADGMDMKAASKKANIHYASGRTYYSKYQKEHHLDPPALKYRKDKIKELAGYIIHDKMTIKAASKKANIHYRTGTRYYRQYRSNQKRDVPIWRI